MKRTCKFLTIPISFAETSELSLTAKWVAITIDSYVDNPSGTSMGVRAIQTATNLSAKEVKDAMTELYEHGAMEVTVCEGQKFLKPLLYRESYYKTGERVVIGDKPRDIQPLPYDEISQEWTEYCPKLPAITRWSPQRKNKLKSALKQADLTVEDLYKVFRIISCTPFLNGSSNQFSAHFDWVISKSANLQKIYEGFYNKSFQEKRDYELIMRGGDVSQQSSDDDSLYR